MYLSWLLTYSDKFVIWEYPVVLYVWNFTFGQFFLNLLIFLNYFIHLIEILMKFKAHLVFYFVNIPEWHMCVVQRHLGKIH